MPIYEYKCPTCGVFEVMQGISEDPLTKCPTCKSKKLRKLISETSFQLKGSGWYVTDYGKGKTGAACKEKSNGNGNDNGHGSGESKKESSPESAPKSKTDTASTPAPAASTHAD